MINLSPFEKPVPPRQYLKQRQTCHPHFENKDGRWSLSTTRNSLVKQKGSLDRALSQCWVRIKLNGWAGRARSFGSTVPPPFQRRESSPARAPPALGPRAAPNPSPGGKRGDFSRATPFPPGTKQNFGAAEAKSAGRNIPAERKCILWEKRSANSRLFHLRWGLPASPFKFC